MNKRQKQLTLRTTTLLLTLIGFIMFFIFDGFYSYEYSYREGVNPLYWFSFWTHLSNIGALVWILFAWYACFFKNDKLEKIMNGQFIKNLVFTFILVTGLIFITVTYIPTIWIYTTHTNIKIDDDTIINPSITYRFFVIFTTTFKHVIIPGSFLLMAIYDYSYTESNYKIGEWRKSFILFIFPILYLLWVIVLTTFGVEAPYAVLDYITVEPWYYYVFYIICDLGVAASFIIVSSLLTKLERKQTIKEKNKCL